MIGVFTTTTNTAATCNCSLKAMGGGRRVMRSLSIHAPEGVKPK